jgi:hypothetical protein
VTSVNNSTKHNNIPFRDGIARIAVVVPMVVNLIKLVTPVLLLFCGYIVIRYFK